MKMARVPAALVAGGAAVILKTLALKAADLVPLATAHGGLVRTVLPLPASPAFQTGFHILVGILMALFYAWFLEPLLPGRPVIKGLLYAALAWLANAFVVLPATDEGIAGSAHLTAAGIFWFAAAHTLFFVLLAVWYARLRR